MAWWLSEKLLKRTHFGLFHVLLLTWLTPLFRRDEVLLPLPSLSLVAQMDRPRTREFVGADHDCRTRVEGEDSVFSKPSGSRLRLALPVLPAEDRHWASYEVSNHNRVLLWKSENEVERLCVSR